MNKIYLSTLALIASATISAQVLNPSFENWTAGEPDDWTTLNVLGDITDGDGNAIVPATEETTGATEGNSYIKLTSFNLANTSDAIEFPDGDYGSTASQYFYTDKEFESFKFDVKYDIKPNDTAVILVNTYDSDNYWSGQGYILLAGSEATFTTVTVNMEYTGEVASYGVFLGSSESEIYGAGLVNSTTAPGSWLAVDNIIVGPEVVDAPNVENVVATDISDNGNGTDLRVTFDVPLDESNIDKYYVAVFATPSSATGLADIEAFFVDYAAEIAPNGSDQTFEFEANDVYWKYNQPDNVFEKFTIEEDIEFKVYVFVKGSGLYGSVMEVSNAVTLKSQVSVTDQYKEISIYPNPANNFINFRVDGLENGTVIINSVTGQEVVNTTINGTKQVDVSNLNNGVYIYTVRNQSGEAVKTNKLVIRK